MRWTEQDHNDAVRMYQEGMKADDVAKVIGCSGRSVRKWALDQGITKGSGRPCPWKDDDEFMRVVRMKWPDLLAESRCDVNSSKYNRAMRNLQQRWIGYRAAEAMSR